MLLSFTGDWDLPGRGCPWGTAFCPLEGAGMSSLILAMVCLRKTGAKDIQTTVLRDYYGIVINQNILVLGNSLLVLGFNAFLK